VSRPRAGLGLLAVMLVACGSAQASESGSAFALPVGSARALASATLYTSPDGGIYQNPDRVQITMVVAARGAALEQRVGRAASGWTALRRLGPLTLVGLTIRNDGKAWSDAQLNATQIASDFAPAGTSSGPLRHFYHPMFALALLSEAPSDSGCTVHLDPGESTVVVLVYPPLRPTSHIVWGVFQVLAMDAQVGGRLPRAPQRWNVSACVPPSAPPAT
jgi:hypothetical protein